VGIVKSPTQRSLLVTMSEFGRYRTTANKTRGASTARPAQRLTGMA
jgi:hypothetical protein